MGLLKIYSLFQKNKSFYKFGKIYIESDFRTLLEQDFFRLRNFFWGSSLGLFHAVCLETTSICNRRCSYCPNKEHYRGNYYMPIDLIHKIIDNLSKIGYKGKVCPHFYGEPLIDERLPEIIRYIRKKLKQSKITIYSNGDLLTVDLFKKLIECGANMFEITQHGEGISENMEKIFKFLGENPLYKSYLSYRTKLFLDNRGGLLDIKNITMRKRCFFNSLVINYKGDVILCCNDFFGKYSFGNARKEDILTIWNKPSFKKIRKECGKGTFNLEICKKCVGVK